MRFVHQGPESRDDTRYEYHWGVLRAALAATESSWGPFELRAAAPMNESRQIEEMLKAEGLLDTMVHDTTAELERGLLPVRIPIDRGLLGYRVFLIRAADRARFSAIRDLAGLRGLRIGQGADWSDVEVLRAAGLQVVCGSSYEGLFDMLQAGRFEAFCRGVTEVEGELARFGPAHPNLVIEPGLLLYDPMPVYFWFRNDGAGRAQARRVEEGLRRLMASGRFEQLFRARFGHLIEGLDLGRRRLIRIGNPVLPPGQPLDREGLWFRPRTSLAPAGGR